MKLTNFLIFLVVTQVTLGLSAETLQSELKIKSSAKNSPSFWQEKSYYPLEIEAHFTELHNKAAGGNFQGDDWDSPEANMMEATYMNLKDRETLQMLRIPILIRARGMSSLSEGEAEFPKLKVKIESKEARETLKHTELDSVHSFRLNTHLTNNENIQDPKLARTPFGRLRSENSPLRENLAYELARVLDLQTPNTRLAQVNYIEASDQSHFSKKALMLETNKSILKRLKAEALTFDDIREFEVTPIDSLEGALFHLFHKIIGNDDVSLFIYEKTRTPTERNRVIFNAELLRLPDGKLSPLVYDLDLSTFVSGYELLNPEFFKNNEFNMPANGQSITRHKLYSLRLRMPQQIILNGIDKIKSLKSQLYATIEDAKKRNQIDQLGYINAKAHLDNFYAVANEVMNTPVLGTKDVAFFHDSGQTIQGLKMDPYTDEPSVLRVGTPIKIIGEENNMYKVAIIDVAWDVDYNTNISPEVQSTVGYVSKNIKLIPFLPNEDVGILDNRDI